MTKATCAYLAGLIDVGGYFAAPRVARVVKLKFCLVASQDVLQSISAETEIGGRVFEQGGSWRWEIYDRKGIIAVMDAVADLVRSARVREQIEAVRAALKQ